MFKKSVNDLEIKILSPHSLRNHEIEDVDKCYNLWHEVWKSTFVDLKVMQANDELRSDNFIDRDVYAFFYEGKPVGLILGHRANLGSLANLNHSYFRTYPNEFVEACKEKDIKECMILSYVTIHPSWRAKFTDLPLNEMVFCLGCKVFEESNIQDMIYFVRTDRTFHLGYEKQGGEPLVHGHGNNVSVDFCVLSQESLAHREGTKCTLATEELWAKYKSISLPKVA